MSDQFPHPPQSSRPPPNPPSTPDTVIGIDASTGASCAALITVQGTLIRTLYDNGLNPRLLGFDTSATALCNLISRCLPPPNQPPLLIVVALSGAHLQSLRDRYTAHIRQAIDIPSHTRVLVTNETLSPLGLVLPAVRGHNLSVSVPRVIVLVAGVDTIAVSCSMRDSAALGSSSNSLLCGDKYTYKTEKMCGSWGSILGADGSTYAVAMDVLRAALRITDGRIPVIVKKVFAPGGIAVCREDEAKALAITVLYAALAHFSIRADDFEDGVVQLANHLNDKHTSRAEIAALTAVLSSLAASGHALCKQAFADAGHELGSSLMHTLQQGQGEGAGSIAQAGVCVAGDMFNAWREVPDFADAFRGALRPFLEMGGHVFMPKRAMATPVMLTEGGPELAYGCAHAGAVAWALSTEEWAHKAFAYLQKI